MPAKKKVPYHVAIRFLSVVANPQQGIVTAEMLDEYIQEWIDNGYIVDRLEYGGEKRDVSLSGEGTVHTVLLGFKLVG